MSGSEFPPKVVFHHDFNDVDRLTEAWARLAETKVEPLFFQSLEWLRHVVATKDQRGPDNWRMCLATTWREDRLTALWPLSLRREGFWWIARCMDDPFGQFAGFLADDDEDPEQVIDTILRSLKNDAIASGLLIDRVVEDTALHRSLTARGAKIVYSDQSVFLDFRPFDSFQSYLKTRRSKTRKNLRNAGNRLRRDHDIEHEVLTGADDIRSIVAEAFESRLVWMHDHAKTAPAFRDPDFHRLIVSLNESPVKNHLIGFRLKTGSTPISIQWGFLHAGRYYAFISARNPVFDAYSPGRLHLGMVLESCFERGIDVVELMAPASDYKMNWTNQTRRIDDFGLAFNTGGYIYLDLWRRRGRSIARKVYHGLPVRLRRQVAEMTNRDATPEP